MTLIKDLMEMDVDMMGGDEEGMGDGEEDRSKSYFDDDHAKEHAAKFIDRAKELLHFNKKEGDKDEIYSMAKKFAGDYNSAICDEIEKYKYASDDVKNDKEEGM